MKIRHSIKSAKTRERNCLVVGASAACTSSTRSSPATRPARVESLQSTPERRSPPPSPRAGSVKPGSDPSSGRGLRRSRRPVRRPPSTMTPAETDGRGNEQWFRFRATSQSIILAVARRSVPARQDAGASTGGGVMQMPKPDASVLVRRNEIVEALRALVPGEGVIDDPNELKALRDRRAHRLPAAADDRRAAWRRPRRFPRCWPTAIAMASRWCRAAPVRRYRRRAAAGRRHPARPRQVQPHPRDRLRQPLRDGAAGVANLAISNAVADRGFYYAPDPSSQIACSIGGNVAENAGGVHCLKYGLTTNNVLGVEMVLIDGEVVRLGGKHLDSEGYDLLGVVTGSEGLLGVLTEVTVRIIRKAGFGARAAGRLRDDARRRPLRRRRDRRRHHPGRHGDDGSAGHSRRRGLPACRLPARCRGAADHRAGRPGAGSRASDRGGRGASPAAPARSASRPAAAKRSG